MARNALDDGPRERALLGAVPQPAVVVHNGNRSMGGHRMRQAPGREHHSRSSRASQRARAALTGLRRNRRLAGLLALLAVLAALLVAALLYVAPNSPGRQVSIGELQALAGKHQMA